MEKHPGLNPASYLALCRRRTITPEDAAALRATGTVHVAEAAARYRAMLDDADTFIRAHHDRELGMLFEHNRTGGFFVPRTTADWAVAQEHPGAVGGVVPQLVVASGFGTWFFGASY